MNPVNTYTRRELLRTASGSLLFSGILADMAAAEERTAPHGPHTAAHAASPDPLAPKPPHFPMKAKRIIFLYMSGGVSHVDSFDPKPKLIQDAGNAITLEEFKGKPNPTRYLKRPDWAFQPHGKCGTEVSDLFPHIANCVDDLCVIRSMKADHTNHYEATLQIHTGSMTVTRPSIGAWISYGLGTFNRNLPSFVVIAPQVPYAGDQAWGADFLPACHQGTRVVPGPVPIENMQRRAPSAKLQERELAMLRDTNQAYGQTRQEDPDLAARIRSYETAFGMQMEAPEVFDLSKESDATLKMYGLERGSTQGFAWQCLIARRLAERGVRFVELIDSGSSNNWDSHGDMATHAPMARNVDQATAGLLQDLKQRGMLEDTLVVWATEFGRTPFHEIRGHKGREHHHWAFSSWMAGGGVKGGLTYGTTDEYGIRPADNPVHVHDLHATILHLMGLNHERLTFRHAGRDFRLTDVYGTVVKDIVKS